MDAAGAWQAYPRPVAKEIEEMYEYGAPHCFYHPEDLSLCETGARQPDAAEGFMVGMSPPPGVCTHRILFDLNVDIALYEGTFVNLRRMGAPCAKRVLERSQHGPSEIAAYKKDAGITNAAAFGLTGALDSCRLAEDCEQQAPPTKASIEAMDAASLLVSLERFGRTDARLARSLLASLFCCVADEIARQDAASWRMALAPLPFVRAVTGAMLAHRGNEEIVSTGGMLLAPVLTDGDPSREALLMGAQALVATLLPSLPLSGSAAYSRMNPNVMLLLGLVAEHAAILMEAGAVGLFEKLEHSPHVPREMKIKAGVAVEIIRDGDITEIPMPSSDEALDEATYASALAAKERGTAAFRRGEWESAAGEYGAALELCVGRALSREQRAEKVTLHSNRAEAFLKLDEYQAAREEATAALEIDPAHCKSLHRRARALRQLGPWLGGDAALAGAEADLRELTRLGGGAAAAELLREVHEVQAVMEAARGGEQHSHVSQMLEREREARLAGPTPYRGLQRSGIEEQD